MDTHKDIWTNKKAKIEILKDGKRLFFTATILEVDSLTITFRDRYDDVFSFNRADVKQITLVVGDDNDY